MAKSTLANLRETCFIAVVFAGATCECVLLLLFLPPLPLQPLLLSLLFLVVAGAIFPLPGGGPGGGCECARTLKSCQNLDYT